MENLPIIETYSEANNEQKKTYSLTDGGRLGAGFTDERNDCTVRSLAIAFDIPYYEAHKIMEKGGRKRAHRARDVDRVLASQGLTLRRPYPRPTLRRFLDEHPTGVYILIKRGHMFTVKCGKVFDSFMVPLRSRIMTYCEVKR